MDSFTYYTPTYIKFGPDSLDWTGKLVRQFKGSHVLLVYGTDHAKSTGILDTVENILRKSGVFFTELGGVKSNPEFALVQKGIALAKSQACNFVLALGGGSVIDTAKAIAAGMTYKGENLWDIFDRKATLSAPTAGVGVILTIAAAGSEMSDSCVITNNGVKRGCNSNYLRPRFAILDPQLTVSLPEKPTMCGCADILMHTLERYLSGGTHMEITDALSEGLMKTVIAQTDILKKDLKNLSARGEIMWSSSVSHNGLTECGTVKDFSCHALGHELSGKYDVPHGASLTAVFGSWAMYVFQEDLPRFVKFANNVMGIDFENHPATAFTAIQNLVSWFKSIGMPTSLPELGLDLSDADLKELAHACAVSCGGKKGTAKVLTEEDFYNIYKGANCKVSVPVKENK